MNTPYIQVGNKKPILVLLHGWGVSKEIWKNVVLEFSKNYTVYALDLLGFGKNIEGFAIYSLDDYVKQVYDFLNKHNIKKCILLGHSFGGTVATAFAIKHQEKLDKLILYSAGVPLSRKQHRVFLTVSKIFWVLTILPFSVLRRGLVKKNISLQDIMQLYKIGTRIKLVKNFHQELSHIQKPVLLIAGRYDFIVPLRYQLAFQRQFPHAQMVIFNKSTHGAHVEEKRKFLKRIKEFIDN